MGLIIIIRLLWILWLVDVILSFWNQDPRDYFDSQQASALNTSRKATIDTDPAKRSLGSEESYAALRDSISHIKTMGLTAPIVTPEVAYKVIEFQLIHCLYAK